LPATKWLIDNTKIFFVKVKNKILKMVIFIRQSVQGTEKGRLNESEAKWEGHPY
jgi:hypothetical protein